MDYKHIYNSIIQNRLKNPITDKSIYTEIHHIIPRCFFPKGTSKYEMDKNNLVGGKAVKIKKKEWFNIVDDYLLRNPYIPSF